MCVKEKGRVVIAEREFLLTGVSKEIGNNCAGCSFLHNREYSLLKEIGKAANKAFPLCVFTDWQCCDVHKIWIETIKKPLKLSGNFYDPELEEEPVAPKVCQDCLPEGETNA